MKAKQGIIKQISMYGKILSSSQEVNFESRCSMMLDSGIAWAWKRGMRREGFSEFDGNTSVMTCRRDDLGVEWEAGLKLDLREKRR